MTELLDFAINKLRDLPDASQDEAARILLWTIAAETEPNEFDPETLAAIYEGVGEVARGEFASEEDIQAIWKRYGK
jgi:predicted transcriptional regulator